jgi:hypothetical protein
VVTELKGCPVSRVECGGRGTTCDEVGSPREIEGSTVPKLNERSF